MAETEGVTLLGFWGSPYALRVKWALKLKGVEYKYVEQNIIVGEKELVLQYNPVYKKIPVLIHDGKPIPESLIIVEYIDEVWKVNPLLPLDPHERAKARFWANLTDDKCVAMITKAFTAKDVEEKERAAEEAREHLKNLESGLEGKQFFGGEAIGFVDVVAGWIGIWGRLVEQITDVKLIDEETMPLLTAWFDRFLEIPTIKELIPPWDKLLELNTDLHKRLTAAST